jgi:hypothetical protein
VRPRVGFGHQGPRVLYPPWELEVLRLAIVSTTPPTLPLKFLLRQIQFFQKRREARIAAQVIHKPIMLQINEATVMHLEPTLE